MAKGIDFPEANGVFKAPKGDEDRISELPVFTNGKYIVSCWELSYEEIEEVIKTRKVYLGILGQGMPPVIILGDKQDMRDLLLDHGGTWK